MQNFNFSMEHIFEMIPAHIYWLDKNNVYMGCNTLQAKSAGFNAREEIIGKKNQDFPTINKELAAIYDKNNLSIMQSGIAKIVQEPFIAANGIEMTMLSHKIPLLDSLCNVIGMFGISMNMTKIKQPIDIIKEAEKKLVEAIELAEAADKIKTEFLENMRHDLRTPLSGIVSLAGLLNHEADLSKMKVYAKILSESSTELLRFLNEILESAHAYSNKMSLLKKRFALDEILDRLIKFNYPKTLEKKLDLTLDIDPAIPKYLIGDAAKIYRIGLELVTNALKFTKQGYVKVAAKLYSKQLRDIVLQISVTDTGMGIPEEKHDEIFTWFTRLIPAYSCNYKGAGLGLAIVKQYIADLEGELYLESSLNNGSKFTCIIPVREAIWKEPAPEKNKPTN